MEVVGHLGENNQMSLAYEKQVFDKRGGEARRLSCTLITGFLGSGKTTLVKHILRSRGDLRVAVLVNDYADLDIDSLFLLDTPSLNSALGLPSLSLVNGCACCKVSGQFKDAVDTVLRSKHNFDYLIVETSGLADPIKISKVLREMGVQLDVIVTVVDVEAVSKHLKLPIAMQQLTVADVVLVNKCDLANLSTISDIEDLIEQSSKDFKAVRCRFCRVPLELVLNLSFHDITASMTSPPSQACDGILSHEAHSRFGASKAVPVSELVGRRNLDVNISNCLAEDTMVDAHDPVMHSLGSVYSRSFSSTLPISMVKLQRIVTKTMYHAKGLIRAKGVLWLNENRGIRLIFHWSGQKRAEATYGGQWECPPSTSLIFISSQEQELDMLMDAFADAQLDSKSSTPSIFPKEHKSEANGLVESLATDSRFKVSKAIYPSQEHNLASEAEVCVTFGLIGSPLKGIHEVDLNEALMHFVNGRGKLFLTAVTSWREDHLLQLALEHEDHSLDVLWKELSATASSVRARFFKDTHHCRCDLHHHHNH